MAGYDMMAKIAAASVPDIRSHSYTFYWLCRVLHASRVVELGVRSGDSTRAFLAGVMDTKGSLHSYDLDGDAYKVRDVSIKLGIDELDWNRWHVTKSDSAAAAQGYDPHTCDIVFIDTDHSFETTLREIIAWNIKVRPGGIMVFHDSSLNEPGRDGVFPAIQAFLETSTQWTLENHPFCGEGDTGLAILWKKS